jgi:ribosome-binding factor A
LENRNAQHHKDRQVEAIKEELVTILAGELTDPRIGLVTLNELVMSPSRKAMRAYVAVEGDEAEQKKCVTALNEAVGYIRHSLAASLGLRVCPDIHFVLDHQVRESARIEELLHRIEKRDQKRGRKLKS